MAEPSVDDLIPPMTDAIVAARPTWDTPGHRDLVEAAVSLTLHLDPFLSALAAADPEGFRASVERYKTRVGRA